MPIRHIPGLDGLRALAVTAVVWHHTHSGVPWLPISGNGFIGVDVFFVLSGFLITHLLLAEGRISLTRFYIRRSLRIFPLYYAVLALLSIYFLVSPGASQRESFLHELPAHLAYVSNWTSTNSLMAISWSLSTEEQFYLLWPPLLAGMGRRALWPLGAFLLVNQAVNFGLLDGALASIGLSFESRSILQVTFTPIILGVLLAFWLRSPILARIVQGRRVLAWVVLWLLVANLPGDLRGAPRLALHLLTAIVLAGIVLQPRALLTRALEWRPLAYIGTISYGVYLLHKIVLAVVAKALAAAHVDTPLALFVGCLALTIMMAAMSFRYFETPLLRLKSAFHSARDLSSSRGTAERTAERTVHSPPRK